MIVRKEKVDLAAPLDDRMRLEEAKEQEMKLKGKLKYVPVTNGYVLTTHPEKWDKYEENLLRTEESRPVIRHRDDWAW